jgi:hypothetical protein
MASQIPIDAVTLDGYLGHSITEFCPSGYHTGNQCAHFVGHALRLNNSTGTGLRCDQMKHGSKEWGASLRVNEIFNVCSDLASADDTGCLVYWVKKAGLTNDGLMTDQKYKHIGIYFGGFAWNYSNTNSKVVKVLPSQYANLYGTTTVIRYTLIPSGAKLQTFADLEAKSK